MRSNGWNRRSFLTLAGGGLAAGCLPIGGGAGGLPLPDGTRVVLVRHMDRSNGNLSALGIQRAALLPEAIADIPLDEIYTHDLRRNVDSTRPLAEARGMEMTLIDSTTVTDTLPGLAAGRSVIWVGNQGNLRGLWDTFELPGSPLQDYGVIAIIEPGRNGRARVTLREFGPRPLPTE